MVQSSRAQGMLQGQPDGSLSLNYVTADQDVQVGDIVITSGLGGVFPKGVPAWHRRFGKQGKQCDVLHDSRARPVACGE